MNERCTDCKRTYREIDESNAGIYRTNDCSICAPCLAKRLSEADFRIGKRFTEEEVKEIRRKCYELFYGECEREFKEIYKNNPEMLKGMKEFKENYINLE